ncbi:MAG: SUF system Fe-S cluster assembly regulator [Chlamydiota bacterium]|nr:SUF system Fe-S cluster assembly regulator [Chlamydiota bacterium]
MIRLKKVTDYGIVILTLFARDPNRQWHNAADIAKEVNLPLPIVSKILKQLAHGALLNSQRGAKGGYHLAQKPEEISVTEMIRVLDGQFAITQCNDNSSIECMIVTQCPVRTNWGIINSVVIEALNKISLADLAKPSNEFRSVQQKYFIANIQTKQELSHT